MTASGFSSRRLRSRSRPTAGEEVASQARWKPPMPFTATIRPSRRAVAAWATGSSAATASPDGARSSSRGPQAGQALGWAWKRRSDGSSYSRRQSGHIRKRAMVVAARS